MLPNPLTGPYLVIGEGKADAGCLRYLAVERGITGYEFAFPEPPQPHGRTGFGDLLAALPADADFRKLQAIIVASDNDENPGRSFHDVRQEIRRAASGYGIPDAPLVPARAPGMPAIAVLMIPWTGEQGNLESLILPAVSEQWPEIRASIDEHLAVTQVGTWSVGRQAKSVLAMMVASVCDRDPTCAVSGMWSQRVQIFRALLHHHTFDRVAEFLRDFPATLNDTP